MKKTLILIFIAFSLTYCTNREKQNEAMALSEPETVGTTENALIYKEAEESGNENAAIVSFDNAVYEFGTVQEGEKVEYTYSFTNTGKSPLIISNVSASCGCTTPEYSKQPINPGEKGSVTVVFDSQNQVGMQQKIITVLSNAEPSRTILQLKGEVKK